MTHVARGTRGDFNPHSRPGDITGRQYLKNDEERQNTELGLRNMRDALHNHKGLELVRVDDQLFAIPRNVAFALIRAGRDADN